MTVTPDAVPALRVALLGCGTVGAEVVRLLHSSGDDLAARIGAPLELVGIAVRRLGRVRDLPVPEELFTTDAAGLVARDDVDLVVEVIGGIEPARGLILAALERGRSVVTANKALLAEDGATLHAAAASRRRPLLRGERRRAHPAAAPAARVARRRPDLPRDRHRQRHHQLHPDPHGRAGLGLRRRPRRGDRLGYAEADPTADVEGFDAAPRPPSSPGWPSTPRRRRRRPPRGHLRGHRRRRRERQGDGLRRQAARIAERDGDAVGVRVHPAMIPRPTRSPASARPTTRCSSRPPAPGG
jgi:homoserine dehydrogenase